MAQTSTVQIYGTAYFEYSWVDAGNFRGAGGTVGGRLHDVDIFQTPGSNIGFKGEEKLGGGLSAWFQCETTADMSGEGQDGWCSRNSALGLKSGFGNLFVGRWDTPFKRSMGPWRIGANETGIFGSAFLMTAGSTSTRGNDLDSSATVDTDGGGGRAVFQRRQANSVNYDSPNFGGFTVMGAFSSTDPATGFSTAATGSKARLWSIGAQYSAGPLYVGAGYEMHENYGGTAVALRNDADDKAFSIGAAYTWGPVRFGGGWTRQKFELGTNAAPTDMKVTAWHIGVDWRIAGPHGLRAAYTKANDTKGSATGAAGASLAGSGSNRALPNVTIAGVVTPQGGTGADLWQIRYVYTFSKRTEFNFGYVAIDNDANAFYRLGGMSTVANGNKQDAFAVSLRHTF
jgi:predicted porin